MYAMRVLGLEANKGWSALQWNGRVGEGQRQTEQQNWEQAVVEQLMNVGVQLPRSSTAPLPEFGRKNCEITRAETRAAVTSRPSKQIVSRICNNRLFQKLSPILFQPSVQTTMKKFEYLSHKYHVNKYLTL